MEKEKFKLQLNQQKEHSRNSSGGNLSGQGLNPQPNYYYEPEIKKNRVASYGEFIVDENY